MLIAAEQLGFGPVYHMKQVFRRGGKDCQDWYNVDNGAFAGLIRWGANRSHILGVDVVNSLDRIFQTYTSTFDYPAAIYPQELYDAYPDAKYILVCSISSVNYDMWSKSIVRLSGILKSGRRASWYARLAGDPSNFHLPHNVWQDTVYRMQKPSETLQWFIPPLWRITPWMKKTIWGMLSIEDCSLGWGYLFNI